MRLDANPTFPALKEAAEKTLTESMLSYFEKEGNRVQEFGIEAPFIFADLSKNLVTKETKSLLIELAENAKIKEKITQLFRGDPLNITENRPALHSALRALTKPELRAADPAIHEEVSSTLERIKGSVESIHSGAWHGCTGKPVTQLVSIGIGGSYLGPMMVIEALHHEHLAGFETHFVSNIDGSDVATTLEKLDPERCLFLVQSKSFTTLETLENARECLNWLQSKLGQDCDISKHLIAVSSNVKSAKEFGILEENIFPMWDWVGGRYSLWSAIGFPIAFQLGYENFIALLNGAEAMDEHFFSSPVESNLPIMLGLIGLWNRSFLGHASLAVIPYDQQMRFLPEHLQQLDMESNGKTIDLEGKDINYASGPIIFGGAGTNGQHAYHQLFHQGRGSVPIDFIIAKQSPYKVRDHHAHLIANCLAQSKALMKGKTEQEALDELLAQGMPKDEAADLAPHKKITGNKPNNVLVVDKFTSQTVGALIAMYEHKVFVQGQLWGINSFDQWGVELGKILEKDIFPLLSGKGNTTELKLDASTANLIKKLS